jgi:membrane fusion protein (multidrug efflux system)
MNSGHLQDKPERKAPMQDPGKTWSGTSSESSRPNNGGTPKPRPSKAALWVFAGVVLMVAASAASWIVYYETRGKYFESTNDACVDADMVTVAPKVPGYVDQVFVANNETVRAGQPLVHIDAREYEAQVAHWTAQVAVAHANTDNVRASVVEQHAAIEQARAEVALALSEATYASNELARYAPLVSKGVESEERLTTVRREAEATSGKLSVAKAALAVAQRRVESLEAQVHQAAAQEESAKAQLAAADVSLESTTIRASVDGKVGDKTVQLGHFVQAGTRLMSVVPMSDIYVTANFKETQIGRMQPGQVVTITVDALPGQTIKGRVASISPGTGAEFSLIPPQNATGNFTKIVQRVPVRIAIEPEPGQRRVLVPGLSVTVTADTFPDTMAAASVATTLPGMAAK